MPEPDTVVLTSAALTATFVPGAGMIGTSLADGDAEFLGQRRGLDAYRTDGKTMGIPLLYPWANRLGGNTYDVDGGRVTLTPGVGGVRVDDHDSPMHGILAAYPDWVVTEQSTNSLEATVDFSTPGLLASFPFPHVLSERVVLSDRTLTIATTIRSTGDTAVPLCFGYHLYFTIPGVPREDWMLRTPSMRHLAVDANGLPTGASDTWPGGQSALGQTGYDDGFDQVPDGASFAVSGGDRRITVVFETGYPAAQLFAPPVDALIAIEPMAAPTDALRRGGYRVAEPGATAVCRFAVRVDSTAVRPEQPPATR